MVSSDGIELLPAAVLSAWGRQPARSKGPRSELSVARILEAAIRVADEDGLGAVSMSRVAEAVGSSTMALYRHVASKDELLTLMVDAAYGMPPEPPPGDPGWRVELEHWAWASRAALQRHLWVVHVPIAGPPLTPCQLAWLERGLATLRDTALAEAHKLSIMMLVSLYVRNEVSLTVDLEAGAQAGSTGDAMTEDPVTMYRRALQLLTDRREFPALHAVIDAGVLDQSDHPDEEFVFGLERLLDGIDALVRSSRPARRRARSS